jgi:hypothetical protein
MKKKKTRENSHIHEDNDFDFDVDIVAGAAHIAFEAVKNETSHKLGCHSPFFSFLFYFILKHLCIY